MELAVVYSFQDIAQENGHALLDSYTVYSESTEQIYKVVMLDFD